MVKVMKKVPRKDWVGGSIPAKYWRIMPGWYKNLTRKSLGYTSLKLKNEILGQKDTEDEFQNLDSFTCYDANCRSIPNSCSANVFWWSSLSYR
eukprot:UN16248